MTSIKKLAALLTVLTLLACTSFAMAETETALITLSGSGETLSMDGETMMPIAAKLILNPEDGTATVELTADTMGMTFYLLASEMSDDPSLAMFYMMCQVVGVGTIAEAENGCLVTFAWEYEYVDEASGAALTVPMTLEIAVQEADGAYTATLDYSGIVLELTSAE